MDNRKFYFDILFSEGEDTFNTMLLHWLFYFSSKSIFCKISICQPMYDLMKK